MAVVEEGVITWFSGCSSSLQISIVSVLFIIVYVTVYSLCTSCLSDSHVCLCRREKTNIVFPQKEGVTEQFSRNPNSLEQGESHEQFKQELISTPSQIPAVSMGTSSPQCVRTLPLPSPPSDLMENLEPLLRTPSFHAQECGNVTSRSDEYISTAQDQTDHKYSLLETELHEENPYEYVSELPLLFQSDRAEGESETSSPTMRDPEEFHVNNSDLSNPVNKQLHASAHTESDGRLIGTDPTAVYAAVNWKTKCQKNTETVLDIYVVEDMDDIIGDAAPPVPEKHF